MKHLVWFLFQHFFSLKKRHFLIILQNNNELRSTGGYITHVLDLILGRCQIKKKFLNVNTDLYQHKKVEAPKIIQDMLFDGHLNTWTFRDANYDPDFQKSAQKMIEFYNLIYSDKKVFGLLTINYSFIENWLKVIGTVSLKNRKIDYQNLFTFVSSQTSDIDRHDLNALSQRKAVLSLLAKKIILKTLLKPWLWIRLVRKGSEGFKSKALQLYDPKNHSSNFIRKPNQDFFSLIENNYLGLKSNRYLFRTIHHDSFVTKKGDLVNIARARWEHFGISDYPLSGNYRAHVRFYLPKEAILETMEGYEIDTEGDFLVVSSKILIKPKGVLEKMLKYHLPKHFFEERYDFRFLKQSGVQNELLRKTFQLTHSLSFKETSSIPFAEGVAFKSFENIKSDISLQLEIKKNTAHPRVYSHAITGPQEIVIRFNEAIEFNKSSIPISIYRKNQTNQQIEVEKVTLLNENQWLLIKTKNLPNIEEAFYHIELKNITNTNGIKIQPHPRTLTVVYRSRHFKKWQNQLKKFQTTLNQTLKQLKKGKKPIVHVYTLCYNEEVILPYFLGHYSQFAERITIFDNQSTDQSKSIAKAHSNVVLKSFDTKNQINDNVFSKIKNHCWKESRGKADFVIVCDMDEFLYHPDMPTFLGELIRSGFTIAKPHGFDMVSEKSPSAQEQIYDEIKHGVRSKWSDKMALFNPNQINEIGYEPGSHSCKPLGKVKLYKGDENLKLLHYKYIDRNKFIHKNQFYAKRLSKVNKKLGWGKHYTRTHEEQGEIFEKMLEQRKLIV